MHQDSRENENPLSYRLPMRVREAVCYHPDAVYPLCPRCNIPLEREYQNYCDRCGQALDWNHYDHVLVIHYF